MKNPLARLVDNVRTLSPERVFLHIFKKKEVRNLVARLVREQLGRGEDSTGGLFMDYAPASVDFYDKPTQGNPYFNPEGGDSLRFYDTGKFYKSIMVRAVTETLVLIQGQTSFIGDDGEAVDLTEISQNIIGLNEESLEILLDFVLVDLIIFVNETITAGYK